MSISPTVLSITSGKGGVGKTNLSVNIACLLGQMGKKVLLLDADLGLANVDVLLGMTPPKNIFNIFNEGASLKDVLFRTPYGFSILPASSGVSEMLTLNSGQKMTLLDSLDSLEEDIDYLIADTGAGIHDNVIYFNIAAQERLVVLTPEPTSLTDAYALIKVLSTKYAVNQFRIVVNMADSAKQATDVYARLSAACDRFLDNISLDYIGFVPKDGAVRKSVIMQKPFSLTHPAAPATQALHKVVSNIIQLDTPKQVDGNIKFFWKKLLFQE